MANAEHLEILKSGVEEWNRWRDENEDVVPVLSRCSLSGAELPGINLRKAELHSIDFSGANLQNSIFDLTAIHSLNFEGANLSGASLVGCGGFAHGIMNPPNGLAIFSTTFSHADLSNADLSSADLRAAGLDGANLEGALLRFTNLTYASLKQSKFQNCQLDGTVFGFNDLSTCIGLSDVEVHSSCVIDFLTLNRSKNIPKQFLIKIGLPELYIEYLPDFFDNGGIRFFPVFLSHSWTNKDFARKLYDALTEKGVSVFFDEKNMKPGDNIFNSISRGIDYYDKTILICSQDSLESWWVDQELELVTEKERNLQKETGEKTGLLIPITIDDHIYNWQGGKRMAIRNRVIGNFRNWQDDTAFEKSLNDLIHALNVGRPDIKPPSYLRKK